MSKVLKTASAVAIAASTLSILMTTESGLAFQQAAQAGLVSTTDVPQDQVQEQLDQINNSDDEADQLIGEVNSTEGEVVQPLPDDYVPLSERETADVAPVTAENLRQLVAQQNSGLALSEEMRCLAGTVYFESKGEPLLGQLAVAKVVINRAKSPRFPNSYCGVVFQRKQFSFVRGGRMPRISTGTNAWRNAVAIAQIADSQSWDTPVDNALFFHARRISPGWRRTRVGTVGNHVFYR